LPLSIRIDNGAPLGDPQRKRLSELTLWLTGMNINVILNRPRRPTDNAKVERMQRTTKNWAVINKCSDIQQLTEQLNQVLIRQRARYKVRRFYNKTRLEQFPEVLNNLRKYNQKNFDAKRAHKRLSEWQFARQVSKNGTFSLYSQVYYLGTIYAKQHVSIKFNTDNVQWEVSDSVGNHIKSIEAKNMDATHIWNLTVGQRTKK